MIQGDGAASGATARSCICRLQPGDYGALGHGRGSDRDLGPAGLPDPTPPQVIGAWRWARVEHAPPHHHHQAPPCITWWGFFMLHPMAVWDRVTVCFALYGTKKRRSSNYLPDLSDQWKRSPFLPLRKRFAGLPHRALKQKLLLRQDPASVFAKRH